MFHCLDVEGELKPRAKVAVSVGVAPTSTYTKTRFESLTNDRGPLQLTVLTGVDAADHGNVSSSIRGGLDTQW
jgi:hypothetical protein